jgi:hypothetical protein
LYDFSLLKKLGADGTIVAQYCWAHARSGAFDGEVTMNKRVTLIIRSPDQIRSGIEAAQELAGTDQRPRILFFCPGCLSGRACREKGAGSVGPLPPCFADRKIQCLPGGFHYAGGGRIARMLRNSDIVIPL